MWATGLSCPHSQLGVPLTAQHLHLRLAERTTYHGTRRAGVSFDYLHARTQMCSDSWYTRVAVCGSKRKMVQGR